MKEKNNIIQKIPKEAFKFLQFMRIKKDFSGLWKLLESYLIDSPTFMNDLNNYLSRKELETNTENLDEVIKEDIQERDTLLQDIEKGDLKEGDLNEEKQENDL